MKGLVPLGDRAVRAPRPPNVDARALFETLRALDRVEDVVVTEQHVAIYGAFDRKDVARALEHVAQAPVSASVAEDARTHVVRVRYDGEDLDEVAAACGLARDDLIARHANGVYVVKMIGFLPGFAYLGQTDPAIRVPRRKMPRARVPANAVAMAADYTGIYPFPSPGGWNIVGHAIDVRPFDPEKGALFALGDVVRFEVAP